MIVIGGALSLALASWSALAPGSLPAPLLVAMPGRPLNVNVMAAGALLMGLFGAIGGRKLAQALLLVFTVALVVSSRSMLWTVVGTRPWRLDVLSVLFCAAAGLLACAAWARAPGTRALRTGAIAVTAFAAFVATLDTVRGLRVRAEIFRDRTNDPLFEAASRASGPLLTGGELFLIQLRTRRPVLLDGGTLDTLPYALESGPAMDAILRDVYGIDLFNPPEEARGGGRVPANANRAVWERYSADRWREIGRHYGVTQVVTPEGWKLELPHVVTSAGLSLFEIRD
jgi:hypothetical protein